MTSTPDYPHTVQLVAQSSSPRASGPSLMPTPSGTIDLPPDQYPILDWFSQGSTALDLPLLVPNPSGVSTDRTLNSLPVTTSGHPSPNLVPADRRPKPKKERPKKAKPSTAPRKKSAPAKAPTHGNISKWLTSEPTPSIPD